MDRSLLLIAIWVWVLGTSFVWGGPRSGVSVLTLNTWLLDWVAQDIDDRRTLLPERVAELGADIIFLQEVWGRSHKDYLKNKFRDLGYRYSAQSAEPTARSSYYAAMIPINWLHPFSFLDDYLGDGHISTPLGWVNGLLTLSKFPLSNVREFKFSVDTQIEERLVSKGAVAASAQIGEQSLVLVNTHLGARTYSPELKMFFPEHTRKNYTQLRELLDWVSQLEHSGTMVMAGDFNFNYRIIEDGQWTERLSEPYQDTLSPIQSGHIAFLDTFHSVHGIDSPGHTCGRKNRYSVGEGGANAIPNETIDYIFVSQPSALHPVRSRIVFDEYLSTELESGVRHLSDHFGVFTFLEWEEQLI